jgi:peptide/nickel transport system substrate-binding protein
MASLFRSRILYRLVAIAGMLAVIGGLAPKTHASHGAAPRYGGSITARDNAVPDCLDPQKTALGASDAIFEEVVDTLVTQDEKGKLRPSLALKWKFANGGKVITFYLRHGVRFSNGDNLTAGDVKATFLRALNPATKSPGTFGFLGPMKTVKVIDPYTVQLVMKTAYRPLMTNLAIGYEGILDVKAMNKEGSGACQRPIGSGPYKVQSVAADFSTVTLVRNPYHTWETAWAHNQGKPYLDKVTFTPILSDATAISELLNGAIDITTVPGPQLARIKGNSSIKQHKIYTQGEYYLGFNTAHSPFDSVAVRKAISEAINRSDIIKAALQGLGEPAYSPIPQTLPYYDKTAPSYSPKYNPSAAQQVLSANHVTGPYTLLSFNDPTSSAVAEIIQAELANVGVKNNINLKAIGDYIGVADKGQFDLNTVGWGWNDPDLLYQFFHSSQANGAGLNWTSYKSATLDNLIIQGRETVSPKKAKVVYQKLQKFMLNQALIDPLYVPLTITATSARLKGFHTNISGFAPLFQDLYL